MPTEIETAVGRIVWGSATKTRGKTRKNPATNALEPVMKDGVQVQVLSFGLAIPKDQFAATIWPALSYEANLLYQGGQVPPKFAWKYQDGDGVDDQGKPYSAREGYAGCFVLAISSELPNLPPIFRFNNGKYDQLPAEAVKTGDYVTVGLNIKGNIPVDRTQTPGLYINPLAINFVGYGTEIVSGGSVDPNALFKGQQHQLPPGASATPIGGNAGVGMPGMGVGYQGMTPPVQAAPMQQQQYAPPVAQPAYAPPIAQPAYAPAPVAQPGGMPGMAPPPMQQAPMMGMPAPAPDFVHNAGMPPMQQPMMGHPQQQQYAPPVGQPGGMPGMMPGMMPGR